MRILSFFFLAPTLAWAQADWSTTNEVAPYSPTVNVPGVTVPGITVPQVNSVEIYSATNAPPAPRKPTPRSSNSYLPLPSADEMAHRSMIIPPVTFPETPAGTAELTNLGTVVNSSDAAGLALTKPVLFNTTAAATILSSLQIFPADNPWHQNIAGWPLHPNSTNIIASIGPSERLHFNLDMNFVLVPQDQPRLDVDVTLYSRESDPGPFPVPDNVPIEGWPAYYSRENRSATLEDVQRDRLNIGGDRHAIVVDPVQGMLYEFFAMRKTLSGWSASQASVFDLKSNKLRPDGWTSADAAGLPIFPAIVRYDEIQRGVINHALRVTVRQSRRAYVAPATHFASNSTDPNLPRMGERLRLKQNFDTNLFTPEVRTILIALKTHGMFVADNGNVFAISIAPDERMPDTLDQLGRLTSADFEVVTAPK